jgi:hypothetical protein
MVLACMSLAATVLGRSIGAADQERVKIGSICLDIL